MANNIVIKYITSCGKTVEYVAMYQQLMQDEINNIAVLFNNETSRIPQYIAMSPDMYGRSYNNLFPQILLDNDGNTVEIVRTARGPCRVVIVQEWTNFIVIGQQSDIDKYNIDKIFDKEVLS